MKVHERNLLLAEYIRLGIDLLRGRHRSYRKIPEWDRKRLGRIRKALGMTKREIVEELSLTY
jgi:hypothetical protein